MPNNDEVLHGFSDVLMYLHTTSTHLNKSLRWCKILNMYIQEPFLVCTCTRNGRTMCTLPAYTLISARIFRMQLENYRLWNDIDLDLSTALLQICL